MAPFLRTAICPLAPVIGILLTMAPAVAASAEGRSDRPPRQQYFPAWLWERTPCEAPAPSSAGGFPPLDDFRADWFSAQLRAAGEPSLYLESERSQDTRSVRFTWLRTFHAPIVVRIDTLANGETRLIAKRLSGYGGYAPGRVAERIERTLSRDEAAKLERALADERVLELLPRECGGTGGDGANWIFESNDRGAYRYLERHSPKAGAVWDAGLLLLSFTGWTFDPVY